MAPATSKDLAAYKELRGAGFQPRQTAGAAKLLAWVKSEARAGRPVVEIKDLVTRGGLPQDPLRSDGPMHVHVTPLAGDFGDEVATFGDEVAAFSWLSGDWDFSGEVAVVDGNLLVRRLTISPSETTIDSDGIPRPRRVPPAGGITGQLVRQVRFDQAIGEITATIRRGQRRYGDWSSWLRARGLDPSPATLGATSVRAAARRIAGSQRRRGRARLSDDLLRDVSLMYLAACQRDRPGSGAVYRTISERLASAAGLDPGEPGRETFPIPRIRYWISQARERGFLTKAHPGKPGAHPGPRLREKGTQ